MESLTNLVLRSLRWLLAGRLTAQVVTWCVTIIVIRLLSPADYGLMALAGLFVGFFGLFEELGMSAAIIQRKELSDTVVANIYGLLVVVGAMIYGLIYALAPLLSAFFEEPMLATILPILALRIPITSISSIPSALLQREMNFRKTSIIEFVSVICGSLATLIFAIAGFGVWSLIYGVLVQTLVSGVGLHLSLTKLIVPSFHFRSLRKEVQFGGTISVDRIIWYLYAQADVFFIGKFLGKETLGVYSVAMQLATLPMQKVSQILNQVGFAAFSRIQSELPIVREKLGLSVKILGMISFPLFFGIASVSPEIVDVFLGEKWLAVTAPLGLLAIAVPLRMINTLTPTMLFSIGRPGVAASNSLIAAAIMIPLFFVASTYGDLNWVCAVWLLGYPAYFSISTKRALSIIDYSWLKYMGRFARYLLLAATMLLVIFSARSFPQIAALPDVARLIIFSMFGAILYVGTLVAVDREGLLKVWRLARNS